MLINMKEWQRNIIESEQVQALPIMTYPGLGLTGQTIMDVVTNGEKQFACMNALAEEYPAIASVSMMDLSVEAEAFDSKVHFSEKEAPTVVGHIVKDRKSANALKVPIIGTARTGAYLKAVEMAAQQIKSKPIFGGQIGPFSLACRLMDMRHLFLSMKREPDFIHIVLEKATAFLIEYARAIKTAGANGLIIAEPAAGLVSPSQCDEFSSMYVKRIVEAVQDSTFMVILHNCGHTVNLVKSMLSTGAGGLHFGNSVSMKDIMPQIPPDRIAFGNIDPAGLFRYGTAEEVTERVKELLEDVSCYNNFVLSSGCDIPPGVSFENINAFFSSLEKYNEQREMKVS